MSVFCIRLAAGRVDVENKAFRCRLSAGSHRPGERECYVIGMQLAFEGFQPEPFVRIRNHACLELTSIGIAHTARFICKHKSSGHEWCLLSFQMQSVPCGVFHP